MESNTINLTKQELIDLLEAKATLQAVQRIVMTAPSYSWDTLLKGFFTPVAVKADSAE